MRLLDAMLAILAEDHRKRAPEPCSDYSEQWARNTAERLRRVERCWR